MITQDRRYKWDLNVWTGDYITKITSNTRMVRMRGGGLYLLEHWGDYSLNFPISGGWHTTFKAALAHLARLEGEAARICGDATKGDA